MGIFDWATNSTYGAGSRPWNGQNNKTAPSAGVIAEGFDPENPLYADVLNWVFNKVGLAFGEIVGATTSLVGVAIDGIGGVATAAQASHIYVTGTAPGIVGGTNAGTSPTITLTGNDTHGRIAITPGAGPSGTVIATITLAVPFPNDVNVILQPSNPATASLATPVYPISTGSSWTMNCGTVLSATVPYQWRYICIGR